MLIAFSRCSISRLCPIMSLNPGIFSPPVLLCFRPHCVVSLQNSAVSVCSDPLGFPVKRIAAVRFHDLRSTSHLSIPQIQCDGKREFTGILRSSLCNCYCSEPGKIFPASRKTAAFAKQKPYYNSSRIYAATASMHSSRGPSLEKRREMPACTIFSSAKSSSSAR